MIAGDRNQLLSAVKNKMANETRHIGVEIIDVRLKRVDYVDQINSSVFERMKSERTRVANELRSIGEAESEKIRADADKQKTVILAEAFRDAEKIKGEGDARASPYLCECFQQEPRVLSFFTAALKCLQGKFQEQEGYTCG